MEGMPSFTEPICRAMALDPLRVEPFSTFEQYGDDVWPKILTL